MKRFLLFVLPGFALAQAQAQAPFTSLSVTYEYVFADSAELQLADSMRFAAVKKQIDLSLSPGEESDIAKLAVLLGSSEGSNDIFYREFNFGQNGDFGNGVSYSGSGGAVNIGTGIHAGREAYYAEVFAIKQDGTLGGSVKAVINQ